MGELLLVRGGRGAPVTAWGVDARDDDAALTTLYTAHYRGLVRLAALMLRDRSTAEEVVQDAFVGLARHGRSLRDPDKALGYLRRSVVNGVRSAGRRRTVAFRAAPVLAEPVGRPDATGEVVDRLATMAALARLPQRQREVLVLRYYAELSEAEIAQTLGISRGSVKQHAARGLAALRPVLGGTR